MKRMLVWTMAGLAMALAAGLGARTLAAQNTPGAMPGLQQFWAGGAFPGSFLGVGVAEIDSERAHALNLKEEYGVEITRVETDSPAEKAGLKPGDVVLEYNGQRVEGIEQFQRVVRETPPGRAVKLVIARNGASQTVAATIGAHKGHVMLGNVKEMSGANAFVMPDIQIPDMPSVFTTWRSSLLGVEAESLGSQLAEYFGVKDGVLVRSVLKASPADKAGLKAGDVIIKVDGAKVTTPGEVSGAVRSAKAKKSFAVDLVRDHHEMQMTVLLNEDRSEQSSKPRVRVVRVTGAKL